LPIELGSFANILKAIFGITTITISPKWYPVFAFPALIATLFVAAITPRIYSLLETRHKTTLKPSYSRAFRKSDEDNHSREQEPVRWNHSSPRYGIWQEPATKNLANSEPAIEQAPICLEELIVEEPVKALSPRRENTTDSGSLYVQRRGTDSTVESRRTIISTFFRWW
jgi:hypothetical protein